MNNLETSSEIEAKLFLCSLDKLTAKLSYDQRLERAWILIQRDYADPDLNLQKAAKASGTNKDYLNVLLRRTTGFTFYQLLIRYRILAAIALMKAKNQSILEVALQNGFGSLNSFEKNFHRLMGTSPRKFRANCRL